MKHEYHFEEQLIDFRIKRLGLKHEPKTQSTESQGATFNEIAEALVAFKKSFLPKISNHGTK